MFIPWHTLVNKLICEWPLWAAYHLFLPATEAVAVNTSQARKKKYIKLTLTFVSIVSVRWFRSILFWFFFIVVRVIVIIIVVWICVFVCTHTVQELRKLCVLFRHSLATQVTYVHICIHMYIEKYICMYIHIWNKHAWMVFTWFVLQYLI